jgi:hypothetical protein
MNRPTSVTVFGILNIVFGVLGLCGMVFTIAILFGGFDVGADNPVMEIMEGNAFLDVYQKAGIALGFIATIALIAAGIALLQMRRWGRTVSIVYACYAILSTLVGIVINFFFLMMPMLERAGDAAGPERAGLVGGAVGGTLGGCVGLIYPVLLLYFMLRPNVRAAFEPFPFDQSDGVRPFTESGNPYQSP